MSQEYPLKKSVREFYGARASDYDAVGKSLLSNKQALMWLKDTFTLLKMIDSNVDNHILDIATGTGAVAILLAKKYRNVTTLDLTKNMLEKAALNARKVTLNKIDFTCGDVENMPFRNNLFDAITCQRAFHYFPSFRKTVSEMKRVLKPGGQAVIGSIVFSEEKKVAYFEDSIFRNLNKVYNRYLSLNEFNRIFEEEGFSDFSSETSRKAINFDDLIMTWTDLRPGSKEKLKEYHVKLQDIIRQMDEETKEKLKITSKSLELTYSVMSWKKN